MCPAASFFSRYAAAARELKESVPFRLHDGPRPADNHPRQGICRSVQIDGPIHSLNRWLLCFHPQGDNPNSA